MARHRVHDERGAGEVPLQAAPVQRIGVGVDEGDDPSSGHLMAGIAGQRRDHRRPGGGQVPSSAERARLVDRQPGHAGLERCGSPGTHHRQGSSAPAESPMRVPTAGWSGGGVPSSTRVTPR